MKWYFENKLPITVLLYISRLDGDVYIGKLEKFGSMETMLDVFEGDVLQVVYPKDSSKLVLFPVQLSPRENHVSVGTIAYINRSSGAGTVYSNADISSLVFHNRVSVPINIYYRGNKIGSLPAFNGNKVSLLLNNNGFGFQMLDRLYFRFIDGTPYNDVQLSDNFMTDIVVGHVSQKYHGELTPGLCNDSMCVGSLGVNKYHPNDIYSYRIAQPQIFGIQQFITDARYNTIRLPGQ